MTPYQQAAATTGAVLAATCLWAACAFADPSLLDFNRDVRPLLASRCFKCHGPDVHEAGLRLDQRSSATAVLESGRRAIVPSDGNSSELLVRIASSDPDLRMPPASKYPPLSAEQIDLLRRWIESGAKWETHWAYIEPKATVPPTVQDKSWPEGPMDAFLLRDMQAAGLAPSRTARPETLLRRAHLDLVGLPPTIAEQDRYLADDHPDAFERVIDRLLASPHHGERQAILWLDLARYADTDGYALDFDRSIWPYRDWVVSAFNADMPFDRFTIEQQAGDLLPDSTDSQKVATGLHRNTRISTEAGSDPEEYRIEAVLDRVNTTGSIWLGSTIACAQCHSHKFDPITQADYYRLMAFFNNGAAETKRDNAGQITNVSARVTYFTELQMEDVERLRSKLAAADNEDERKRIQREIDEIRPLQSLVMQDQPVPRETRIFRRGSFLSPGEAVKPDVPSFLKESVGSAEGADRLALARWLVHRRNPLTARVMVNRFLHQHFGVAMVDTLDDFGSQSPPVRHKDLLDWLAVDFMESGWQMKRLHRTIVTSEAYRQSSDSDKAHWEADPANHHLARMTRMRLPAELVRDNALAIGDILSLRVGGRPVHAFSMKFPGTADTSYRRSVYVLWKRSSLDPTFAAFDAPIRDVCCAMRERTNTPIQSLNLLNDRAFLDAARGLAGRVLSDAKGTDRIALAFRIAQSRPPSEDDRVALSELLARRRAEFSKKPELATALAAAGTVPWPPDVDAADAAAWTLVASVLLNLEETITRE